MLQNDYHNRLANTPIISHDYQFLSFFFFNENI